MNIYTAMGIEPPNHIEWASDDEFESMIECHSMPAIVAYEVLLMRSWLVWLKEHDLTRDDGDKIAHRADHYGYVRDFLEEDGWFAIVCRIEKRIELEYDVHIATDGGKLVTVDSKKSAEASQ